LASRSRAAPTTAGDGHFTSIVGAAVCPGAPVAAGVCWGNVDVGVGLSLDISVAVGPAEPGTMITPVGLGDGKGAGIGVWVGVAVADEQAESARVTSRPARRRAVARDLRGLGRERPMRSSTTPWAVRERVAICGSLWRFA
jgi:hypothetical protein